MSEGGREGERRKAVRKKGRGKEAERERGRGREGEAERTRQELMRQSGGERKRRKCGDRARAERELFLHTCFTYVLAV